MAGDLPTLLARLSPSRLGVEGEDGVVQPTVSDVSPRPAWFSISERVVSKVLGQPSKLPQWSPMPHTRPSKVTTYLARPPGVVWEKKPEAGGGGAHCAGYGVIETWEPTGQPRVSLLLGWCPQEFWGWGLSQEPQLLDNLSSRDARVNSLQPESATRRNQGVVHILALGTLGNSVKPGHVTWFCSLQFVTGRS